MTDREASDEFLFRTGTIAEVVALTREIPEWDDPYGIHSRGTAHLPALDHILLVEADGRPVAFRAGYECAPAAFRCWLAGVVPEFRRRGLARRMYDHQKPWLLERGFREIRTYTRGSNVAMLAILRDAGYEPLAETELRERKPGEWLDFVKRIGLLAGQERR